MDVTEGHLLGGRVRYAQPRVGFRSGIEPVLLAAAVPARAGERIFEAGSGAGAALLCLAARVSGISGLGIERDPELAALAARNAAANGFAELAFCAADIATLQDNGPFEHALANPPYHPAGSTASADPRREAARRMGSDLFRIWAGRMGNLLRPRGTLTWIIAATVVPACMEAFRAAACTPAVLLPLWPHADKAARLVILQGRKDRAAPFRVAPGLVLHEQNRFTPAAEAILRCGEALAL
jgi:tRNA1Val (adenine37-N6)-methyltransferase